MFDTPKQTGILQLLDIYAVNYFVPVLITYIEMGKGVVKINTQLPWTDVATALGTVFSAFGTVAAITVALWQSRSAKQEAQRSWKSAEQTRRDILQARKDELTPLVSLDWAQAVVAPHGTAGAPAQHYDTILKSVIFAVTNVGNAPALNVEVEVNGHGNTSGYACFNSPQGSLINEPAVHALAGQRIQLVKEITIQKLMPQTIKVKLSYMSVMGERYCSEFFNVRLQSNVRVPIEDFIMPSTPIRDVVPE